MNLCPECGKHLSEKAKRCSCGWLQIECQRSVIADHRCQYSIAQRRCPLPGTMSPYTSGNTWYCRRHYQILGAPQLAEAELRYIENNYQKIMDEEYQDWRTNHFIKNNLRK